MNKGKELILRKLGFVKGPHRYFHNLSRFCSFDFSANSIEGIVCTIFNAGVEFGQKHTQDQIKKALGIEEAVKP